MKRITLLISPILFCLSFSLISCNDDSYNDFTTERTNASALAGEWYVRSYDDAGQLITTYFDLSTFNTAANTTEIWLDDDGTIDLKIKAQGNTDTLTFMATATENFDPVDDDIPELITITNGKIIADAARSAGTRTVVDSIVFTMVKSTDPTTVITIAGHKVTGFLEDEL